MALVTLAAIASVACRGAQASPDAASEAPPSTACAPNPSGPPAAADGDGRCEVDRGEADPISPTFSLADCGICGDGVVQYAGPTSTDEFEVAGVTYRQIRGARTEMPFVCPVDYACRHPTYVPVGERALKTDFAGIFIHDGGTLELAVLRCDRKPNPRWARIAVVEGEYDQLGEVLLRVGVDAGTITRYRQSGWAARLLGDASVVARYNLVVINCGADDEQFLAEPRYARVLREWVAAGGSLYASDWAYDVVQRAFPGFVDFVGHDSTPGAAKAGVLTPNVPAKISDPALAAALGKSTIALSFAKSQWAVIETVDAGVRVYVRGDAAVQEGTMPDVPLAVGFSVGAGKVIYTSFHQEPDADPDVERVLQFLAVKLDSSSVRHP